MARPKWYIVQVRAGSEQAMCGLITRACRPFDKEGRPLLHECFAPQFRTRHKFAGEWRDADKLLLPGYVMAVSEDPAALARVLRGLPSFARVLTQGETFVPLSGKDREWLEDFTSQKDRTVPMSVAYKEDDRVVITSGPLKGKEGLIKAINRSKCLAILEFCVGSLRITARVGLAIVNKTS